MENWIENSQYSTDQSVYERWIFFIYSECQVMCGSRKKASPILHLSVIYFYKYIESLVLLVFISLVDCLEASEICPFQDVG